MLSRLLAFRGLHWSSMGVSGGRQDVRLGFEGFVGRMAGCGCNVCVCVYVWCRCGGGCDECMCG